MKWNLKWGERARNWVALAATLPLLASTGGEATVQLGPGDFDVLGPPASRC